MNLSDDDDDDVFEKEKKLLAMGTVSCASESATTGFTTCRTKLRVYSAFMCCKTGCSEYVYVLCALNFDDRIRIS